MPQEIPGNSNDNETLGTIFIDDRIESYKDLLDHEWVGLTSDRIKGTKLDHAFFGLTLIWKGATNTFRLPYLVVLAVEGVFKELTKARMTPPIDFLSKLQATITNGTSISERNSRIIRDNIKKIANEWAEKSIPQVAFDDAAYWNWLLQINVMKFAIWSTQQLSYSALYFGYEDFVREIIGIANNRPNFRLPTQWDKKVKSIDDSLGKGTATDLFDQDDIKLAREIRNALTHGGGRATQSIKRHVNAPRIAEDGKFSIMPDDVHHLYTLLQQKVDMLITKLLQDKRFGCTNSQISHT